MDLENMIAQYPVCQYQILDTAQIPFSEKVRYICETECSCYGKSWSCPPAVGEVEECRKKCLSYPKALVFTTLAQVKDTGDMEETLATRKDHEKVTKSLCREIRKQGAACLALSSESCQICENCAYPEACRFPEEAIPAVESYGILVTEIAEKCGIDFFYDNQTVTWFGIIFFDPGSADVSYK